ncbi:MAG: hypothetical protein R3B97_09915 [Dehalococcoidia bacterium]
MWPSIRTAGLIALVMVSAFAVLRPVSAAESIRSFVATYDVQADGTINVVEEITWDFGTATTCNVIFGSHRQHKMRGTEGRC